MARYRGVEIKTDIYGNYFFYLGDKFYRTCTMSHAKLFIDRIKKVLSKRKKQPKEKVDKRCKVIQYYPAFCSGFDEQINYIRKVDSIFNFSYVKKFAKGDGFKEFVIYLNSKEHDQYILMAKYRKGQYGVAWINNGSTVNVEQHSLYKREKL